MGRGRSDWTSDRITPGMSREVKAAAQALRELRAEGRRGSRPYRAATLAEAEAALAILEDAEGVSPAMMREQGLTGKHKGKAMLPRIRN